MAHTLTQEIRNDILGILVAAPRTKPVDRRRKISPRSGKALEVLGHAIEYLTDEHLHQGGGFRLDDPHSEAVKILMAANRTRESEAARQRVTIADQVRLYQQNQLLSFFASKGRARVAAQREQMRKNWRGR